VYWYVALLASYYFSTHGCKRVLSACDGADLEEDAAAAASFWRALMSKKLAMLSSSALCHVGVVHVRATVVLAI